MKKTLIKGFTLIELMIVVAIVSILASIAVPAYQDYIVRSQVAEAISLGAGIRQALSTYGWINASWPSSIVGPNEVVHEGEISGTLQGKYAFLSPTIVGTYPSGQIQVTMNSGYASGQTIIFMTTDGAATWSCQLGTLDNKYRPAACR